MVFDWREELRPSFQEHHAHLLSGDADGFGLSIESIRLSGGATIATAPGTVTAIVGANNVGKSTLLREIHATLSASPGYHLPRRLLVEGLQLRRQGSAGDLTAWLAQHAQLVLTEHEVGFRRLGGQAVNQYRISEAWVDGSDQLGPDIANMICFYGNAEGRLGLGSSAELRASVSDAPLHPVHYLQDDLALRDELSSITERIFRRPLTLDTLARTVRLRVGRLSIPAPRVDAITPEYTAAMAQLPPLDQQGDGMRSLLGQLLPLLTGNYPLVLIDEPEAFLHPPQARALGEELGRISGERGAQVIVATHDRNLLAGLLASGAAASVVRLTRSQDDVTSAHQLDSTRLQRIWSDPVLRYTNILDGLFHRLVVLAEAEGDCGYLAAGLEAMGDDNDIVPASEVLFVPTGGKDGMAKVAEALKAVDVPVVAAPDLDRLSEKAALRRLAEALGSQWGTEIDLLWEAATADLRAPRAQATAGHVLDAISSALETKRSEPYVKEHRDVVNAHLRANNSPWEAVKEYGVAAFKGKAHAQAIGLLDALEKVGIVLVREGELERLAPEVGVRKGPGWLHEALKQGSQANRQTRAHLERVLSAARLRID